MWYILQSLSLEYQVKIPGFVSLQNFVELELESLNDNYEMTLSLLKDKHCC